MTYSRDELPTIEVVGIVYTIDPSQVTMGDIMDIVELPEDADNMTKTKVVFALTHKVVGQQIYKIPIHHWGYFVPKMMEVVIRHVGGYSLESEVDEIVGRESQE